MLRAHLMTYELLSCFQVEDWQLLPCAVWSSRGHGEPSCEPSCVRVLVVSHLRAELDRQKQLTLALLTAYRPPMQASCLPDAGPVSTTVVPAAQSRLCLSTAPGRCMPPFMHNVHCAVQLY